jgi:lysozyme
MSPAVIAARLAKRFEGLSLTPYLCPAGVATIGYGSTRYEDGTAVTLVDPPITQDRARALLLRQICVDYLPAVVRLCPGADTPERAAALTDFAYNLGVGALRSSTLRRKVNAGQWGEVPEQLGRWVYGGGRRLRGLVRRRQAEAELV